MRYGICLFLIVLAVSISPLASADETDFDEWLTDLRKEATSLGISDKVLEAALGNATPIKRVIELDRRQPEFTMTFEEYLSKIASKRPNLWFFPPPQDTAYFCASRNPGIVFLVSKILHFVPLTAST